MEKTLTRCRVVLLGLLIGAPGLGATQPIYQCKTRSDLVGPCRTVHGRLSIYQGTPMARIWPIGTHRLLGVMDEYFSDDEEFAAPPSLRQIGPFDEVFADFRICPLTKSKPGVMQFVCISGAKDIHVKHYLDNQGKSKIVWHVLPDTDER